MKPTPASYPPGRTPESYQDLRVWKLAVDLAAECYARTAAFPAAERFGLTAQMRRAAVSVVSNIAEGHGRCSYRAFSNHLGIARGSVKELEAQLVLAARLGFASEENLGVARELCDHASRMLLNLQRSIGRRIVADRRPPTADSVRP